MNEILKENFLNEYFTFEHILSNFGTNKVSLFNSLATIFLIPQDKVEVLRKNCFNSSVEDIRSYDEYMQYCRTQNYFENSEYVIDESEQIKRMIHIKGNAIRRVPIESEKATRTTILNRLYEASSNGNIVSMRILGFMECEGIYLNKNIDRGYKNIEKAVKWNSVESVLMALYYNESERELNLQRLYSITNKTIYEDIIKDAEMAYNLKTKKVILSECKLLRRTFEQNHSVKPEVFNSQYARLIYSNVISEAKKNRVLSLSKSESIAEVLDLPLNLSFTPECVNSNIKDFSLAYRDEHNEVLSYLNLLGSSGYHNMRPLCITSSSKYVLKLYKKFLSKCFSNANIEVIDVKDLSRYDIEPTKENIFLRRCNEDKNNVFFLFFNGDIDDEIMEKVIPFLKYEKRSKFLIVNMGAEINLEAIMPICLCDKANVQSLRKYCNVVEFSFFTNVEKNILLNEMINAQKEKLKLQSLIVEDDVREALLKRSVDDMHRIIKKSVLQAQKNDGNMTIDFVVYKMVISNEIKHSKNYGFAVTKYEIK